MKSNITPKVTIYIPYEKRYETYLKKAIDSLNGQTFKDYELLVFEENESSPVGLNKIANMHTKRANGEYIMRLDADDWLVPDAIEKMVTWLDSNINHKFVYPDYYLTNERGEITAYIKKERELSSFDKPCLGACTMIRKSYLEEIGGYNESVDCQDGYDLWIKTIGKYQWGHIRSPLFYYRKHGNSLSDKKHRILKARRKIKLDFFTKNFTQGSLACVIPIRELEYKKINGSKELVWRTINSVSNLPFKTNIFVVSESQSILDEFKADYVHAILRPNEFAKPSISVEQTIWYARNFFDDELVMILHWDCPYRTFEHIEEAVHTLRIFNSDSVISVSEQLGTFYKDTPFGLRLLNNKRYKRYEKDGDLYKDNGAIFLTKRNFIAQENILGPRISYIMMDERESFHLDNDFYVDIFNKIR